MNQIISDVYQVDDYPLFQPGFAMRDPITNDLWRYVTAGSGTLAKGKVAVAPTPKTNHHNIAVNTAAAIGDKQVKVTLGATAAVANEYAGGTMVINDNTGEGQTYRILSHPAASASGSLTLTLSHHLTIALTTTTEVTLNHSVYNGAQNSTTTSLEPAGVPVVDIPTGKSGFVKRRGDTGVLADGAILITNACIMSGSVAGAVKQSDVLTDATDASRQDDAWLIGRAKNAGVDTEYRTVTLTLE